MVKIWVRVSVLKDLCDNSGHQKLALNMGCKFEVPANKNKTCRLASVMVLLGLRSGWRTGDP